ncbi:MAG: pyridoxamine 5'-phosphate oxidase family protein [Candidatus Bathyarchaeia archaeon]
MGGHNYIENKINKYSWIRKVSAGNNKNAEEHFTDRAFWLLEEGFFAYLGTADAEGTPHVTPVIFVHDKRKIFFLTSKIAKKLKNIRENRRVALLIDVRDPLDFYNNRAVLVQGKAKPYGLLDSMMHLPTLLRVRRLLSEKYPKYQAKYAAEKSRLPGPWRTTLHFSRLLVEVSIERMSYMRGASQIASGSMPQIARASTS